MDALIALPHKEGMADRANAKARFVRDRQSAARDYVRGALDANRWTATELARKIGVSASTMTRFLSSADLTYSLKFETLIKISEVSLKPIPDEVRAAYGFGATPIPAAVRDDRAEVEEPSNVKPAPYLGRDSFRKSGDDIPVMGTARGGAEGAFELNMGEAIDWVRRPPALVGKAGLYALYVEGDSMEPRFYAGERILVSSKVPVTVNRDVIIQLKPKREGDPITAYLKRLVRQNSEEIEVEQFSPPKRMKFKRGLLESIHVVLNRDETF